MLWYVYEVDSVDNGVEEGVERIGDLGYIYMSWDVGGGCDVWVVC
jgi:hypothetical protein